jgi:hypothetical protein
MLLKLLNDQPGSIDVEDSYLGPFIQWLRSVVEESAAPREAKSAQAERSREQG